MVKGPEVFALGFALLLPTLVSAQSDPDSTRLLDEVVVAESRLAEYVVNAYQLSFDSATLFLARGGSLTDLLRKQGIGHLRSNGPGGLATPSFRGTGGNHTALLWNGITLISPLNGTADLSLLPAGLFDHALLQSGGAASLYGTGSIGGTIHLTNNFRFNRPLQLTLTSGLGSFGMLNESVDVRVSGERLGSYSQVFFTHADNDFNYLDENVDPAVKKKRVHSAFRQWGAVQQVFWQAARHHLLSARVWYQDSQYEVPNPTGINRPGEATERNESLRLLAGWNYAKEKVEFNYQGAYQRHDLEYRDPQINLNAASLFNSITNNAEVTLKHTNKALTTTGVNYTWEQAFVDDYGMDVPVRNRLALVGAHKFSIADDWKLALSVREEFVDGASQPLAPTLSVTYAGNARYEAFANLSRNYRLPTFNDLYWAGGGASGNPELQTEVSLGGEVGGKIMVASWSSSLVVFSNHVDDWIQWLPSNEQIWSPVNVKEVWSRGAEMSVKSAKAFGRWQFDFGGSYSYTLATNDDVYIGNERELDKQLMLTPIHEGNLNVDASVSGFQFRTVFSYTGKQFTDSDNSVSGTMDPYSVVNLWLSKSVSWSLLRMDLMAEINNVFNTQYYGRPGYPMPGINYKATIQLSFIKKQKQ